MGRARMCWGIPKLSFQEQTPSSLCELLPSSRMPPPTSLTRFASPAQLRIICGIQTRGCLRAEMVSLVLFFKIPDAYWLLMCLLATGLFRGTTYLIYCWFKQVPRHFPFPLPLLCSLSASLHSLSTLCQQWALGERRASRRELEGRMAVTPGLPVSCLSSGFFMSSSVIKHRI